MDSHTYCDYFRAPRTAPFQANIRMYIVHSPIRCCFFESNIGSPTKLSRISSVKFSPMCQKPSLYSQRHYDNFQSIVKTQSKIDNWNSIFGKILQALLNDTCHIYTGVLEVRRWTIDDRNGSFVTYKDCRSSIDFRFHFFHEISRKFLSFYLSHEISRAYFCSFSCYSNAPNRLPDDLTLVNATLNAK